MNLEQAKELLLKTHIASVERGRRANCYFMQSGPGLGKSQSVVQYCMTLARILQKPVGLVVTMLASITSPDVRGFMIPIKDQAGGLPRTVFSLPPWMPVTQNSYVFTPDGEVYEEGDWDGPLPEVGVLFLDEWGQADEDIRKPAAELVLNGKVGTHKLPPGWRVVAAQNRLSDRSGVIRELMHIVNRRALLEIEGSADVWLQHVDDLPDEERPHFLTRAFVRKHPNVVFRDTLPDNAEPFCTPRTLCLMDQDLRVLCSEEDIEHDRLPMTPLASELCAGWIGKPAAAQFFTHIRFAEELPDIEDILANPRTAMLPPGEDAQMICAYMLVEMVDEDTAQAVVRYVLRLTKRMQILAMGMMTEGGATHTTTQAQLRRAKAVTPLPEFTKWMIENKDILIASRM